MIESLPVSPALAPKYKYYLFSGDDLLLWKGDLERKRWASISKGVPQTKLWFDGILSGRLLDSISTYSYLTYNLAFRASKGEAAIYVADPNELVGNFTSVDPAWGEVCP